VVVQLSTPKVTVATCTENRKTKGAGIASRQWSYHFREKTIQCMGR